MTPWTACRQHSRISIKRSTTDITLHRDEHGRTRSASDRSDARCASRPEPARRAPSPR
jgi:hypothetical protein